MKIIVCIGSSCHIKGSQQIVEQLKYLISLHNLNDKVTLTGAFCMDNCMNGVCAKIEDTKFSLQRETVKEFFETEVIGRLEKKK